MTPCCPPPGRVWALLSWVTAVWALPRGPGGEKDLIELMEGVEDVPGTALYEGMPWGAWSSYPEYLDYLATRVYALDVASLIAHGAVRNFVMGTRGRGKRARHGRGPQSHASWLRG